MPAVHGCSAPVHDDASGAGGARLQTAPLALYVHFPWCVRKCPYCDFNSYTLDGALPEEAYLARLERDLAAQAGQVAGRELISVFFGGGTPSLFSPAAIERLLRQVSRCYLLAPDAEVTLEANPGAIERGAFRAYRDAGVNRVSLGAQSFAPAALAALGRIHSPEETQRAAAELHAAGLENFNLDLMYALPGQDVAQAIGDLEQALSLAPAHISHYQLTLEPGTVFAARPPEGLADDDMAASMLTEVSARLAASRFTRYEVSAYARAGKQSRHNTNYWSFGDYLGVGAGAHGKLTFAQQGRILRTTHTREPRRYLASADQDLVRRVIDPDELPFEFMLNALRLIAGFTPAQFVSRTGVPWDAVARTVQQAVSRGLLEGDGQHYRPSARGLTFLNDLLLEFLPADPGGSRAGRPGAAVKGAAEPLFTARDPPFGE